MPANMVVENNEMSKIKQLAKRIFKARFYYLFVLPLIALITIFLIVPTILAFLLSLQKFSYSLGGFIFIGLNNYIKMFSDPRLLQAFLNILYITAVSLPVIVGLSLLLALSINRQSVKGKTFFKVIYFLPVITTWVVVALVWKGIYNYQFGVLNTFLKFIGLSPISWLEDPKVALNSIIIVNTWKMVGFYMVILYANLLKKSSI